MHLPSLLRTASAVLLFSTAAVQAGPPFAEFVDPNPNPGNRFGNTVLALSSGNVVITSPFDDAGGTDAGAVYLFNGATGALISTLTGSGPANQVGSGGVVALSNGNYVVLSPAWDNGAATDAGAVTWGSGSTGVSGVVSSSNSLVGSSLGDNVGNGGVLALSNGNYVVTCSGWDSGAVINVGAVTWGSGSTGVSGVVSSGNSLVGSTASDQVGLGGVVEVGSGNYVVTCVNWDNGAVVDAGMAAWADGTTGLTGVVSSSNSLVGSSTSDYVGYNVHVLSNGNYLMRSFYWDNGAAVDAGAVTWGSGSSGVTGVVSSGNSLVGSSSNDNVGISGVAVLNNGNYVVSSPYWDNGAAADAGAVTWGSGTTGITGPVSSSNSLVGGTANDYAGLSGVLALSNGHYVVLSPQWDNGAVADVGAATWCHGGTGSIGLITSGTSLVGSANGDQVGGSGATALTNGNYVVRSPQWDNGAVINAGAATWRDGSSGGSGVVNSGNSLVGSTLNDSVSNGSVTALSNGHYVVRSHIWDNGAAVDAGAVTWGNGSSGSSGVVSSGNSLVGSSGNDQVGNGGVTALPNGNYVVRSTGWDNGVLSNAGAVSWGNGSTGSSGPVSSGNSLVGGTVNDQVGSAGVTVLSNGHYVVRSPSWDGTAANAGAVTWGNGSTGSSGVVSSSNSLVGSTLNDNVGNTGVLALSNGNYVVSSVLWDNGAISGAGAVTWGNGSTGTTGVVSSSNSLVGLTSSTTLQAASADNVNLTFFGRFRDEGSGKVRLGSQVDGLAPSAPPVITLISPASGTAAGGTSVTITGTGFSGASAVTFGGVNATAFTVDSATQITATTPAGSAGAANVLVTTPGGTNAVPVTFTYITPPMVTDVTSNEANGTYQPGFFNNVIYIRVTFSQNVTVTGQPQLTLETGSVDRVVNYSYMSGSTTLVFTYTLAPGDSSTDLDYLSTTALALNGGTINASSGGTPATLTLPAPGTPGSLGANKDFVISTPAPSYSYSNPNTGVIGGGESITLGGDNFYAPASVTIGGAAATNVVVVNANTITCTTPPGTVGSASVLVTTPSGTSGVNTSFYYYDPVPAAGWTVQSSGVSTAINNVHFIDASTGWLVGQSGMVRKSTDGGVTWTAQTSGTFDTLYGVSFADANIGWASGTFGTLRKTTNGGASWTGQTHPIGAHAWAVFARDASTAWSVGSSGAAVRTTNGTNWTGAHNNPPGNSGSTVYGLNDVQFIDASTGYLVGGGGFCGKSTDGGATWSLMTVHPNAGTIPDPQFFSVSFVSASTGWTAGDNGSIFKTTNGGASWTAQTTGTTANILAVSFADVNNGCAVGERGLLLRTTNGGTTWTTLNSGTPNSLNDVHLLTATTGWAVGEGGTVLSFSGPAVSSEIAVESPIGTDRVDGAAFPPVDAGTANVTETSTSTFRILNNGTGPLAIGAITFTGDAASDFAIGTAPPASIAAGSHADFTVVFTALGDGPRNAWMNIANDDGDEDPFNIRLQGHGLARVGGEWDGSTPHITIPGGSDFYANDVALKTKLDFVPTPGQGYTFLEMLGAGDEIFGEFNDLPDGGVIAMAFNGVIYYFQADYSGGDGNDIVFTAITPAAPPAWAWVKGPKARNGAGIYGDQGFEAPANNPGARQGAVQWLAPDGDLLLFGGYGYGASVTSTPRFLNDFWRYDRAVGQWIWISGSSTANAPSVNAGFFDPSNTPGARHTASTWIDDRGVLWLFGGSGPTGRHNDLWKYETGSWQPVTGSLASSAAGVYGTEDVSDPANTPGARQGAVTWFTPGGPLGPDNISGTLWLFGGTSNGSACHNDLWRFDLGTEEWTWVDGSSSTGQVGDYGTVTASADTNVPGARRDATSWVAADGTLWLFGGRGFNESATTGDLSDLWRFNPTTGEWTWISGPKTHGDTGTYTALGSTGQPSARSGASGWKTVDGKFWLVGGFKNTLLIHNDVWIYDPVADTWTWKLGSSTTGASGVYGTLGEADPANLPGARFTPSTWVTLNGSLWTFGGGGIDGFGSSGRLSDLWVYGIPPPPGAPELPEPTPFPDEFIVNTDPSTSNAVAGTTAYTPVSGQFTGTDADGDRVMFESTSATTTSQGTLTLNENGTWTYTPSYGYTGTATFTFQAYDYYGGESPVRTLVITVIPNPADSDGDGIADAYEQQVWGSLAAADGDGDADFDGQSNYFEFLAGTDPQDGGERLTTAPTIISSTAANGNATLQINHVRPGVNYHLETTSDLETWTRIGAFTFDQAASAELQIPARGAAPQFFRISLEGTTAAILP